MERSVAFKICQNAFPAGPRPLIGWGGDSPLYPNPLGALIWGNIAPSPIIFFTTAPGKRDEATVDNI